MNRYVRRLGPLAERFCYTRVVERWKPPDMYAGKLTSLNAASSPSTSDTLTVVGQNMGARTQTIYEDVIFRFLFVNVVSLC